MDSSRNQEPDSAQVQMDKVKIGEAIRHARQQKGYSQADLASLCQLPRPTLCNIERGHSLPSLRSVVAIAHVLDLSVDQLIGTRQFSAETGNIYLDLAGLLMKGKTVDKQELSLMLRQAIDILRRLESR